MFRPLLWTIFRSQKYLIEKILQYAIKYINLKLNEISSLFNKHAVSLKKQHLKKN